MRFRCKVSRSSRSLGRPVALDGGAFVVGPEGDGVFVMRDCTGGMTRCRRPWPPIPVGVGSGDGEFGLACEGVFVFVVGLEGDGVLLMSDWTGAMTRCRRPWPPIPVGSVGDGEVVLTSDGVFVVGLEGDGVFVMRDWTGAMIRCLRPWLPSPVGAGSRDGEVGLADVGFGD